MAASLRGLGEIDDALLVISDAGAALIATVYPIGLFIVAVNRRHVAPTPVRVGPRRTFRVILEVGLNLALLGAVFSIGGCVVAVSEDAPIRNFFYTSMIWLSGLVLGAASLSVLQSLGLEAAARLINGTPRQRVARIRSRPKVSAGARLRRRART